MLRRVRQTLLEGTRRYFVAGLLVLAPIGITLWVIAWSVERLDNLLLPSVIRLVFPEVEDPPQLPFVGALFTFLVIILTGIIARHFFGYEIVKGWERLLSRVPIARSIYAAVKQLFEAIVHSNTTDRFRRVVLVEYPRKGLYAIAFTTGPARGPVAQAIPDDLVNCFVPTTPNPTSGFYLLVPEEELIEVALSVEDAFKVIMSAGLVTPESVPRVAPEEPASPVPALSSEKSA
ncbi:MAG: DUF502 domain-containing protein [Myxococcota bacterium]